MQRAGLNLLKKRSNDILSCFERNQERSLYVKGNLVAGEADEEEKEMKVKETKRERSWAKQLPVVNISFLIPISFFFKEKQGQHL